MSSIIMLLLSSLIQNQWGKKRGGEESSPSCRWCSQSSFIQSGRSWATVELAFHLFPLSANRWIPYWTRHKATLFSLPSITHLRPLIYFFSYLTNILHAEVPLPSIGTCVCLAEPTNSKHLIMVVLLWH